MNAPKFDICIEAFDSNSDERGWYSRDLVSYGDTPEEVIENAAFFLIDQDGGEIGDAPASGFQVEHALRLALLEQDSAPIKVVEKTIGTEYGPFTYQEVYQDRDGYYLVHYTRAGDSELERISIADAKELSK